MSTGVVVWSQTAASNATADTNVNWAEGQAPSSVNDSARAMMASVAKWRDDNAGTLTTGGTSTAYTVTSNQVFASLAAMSGHTVRLKFNATNGASPTLNVDGLGAKAIVTVTGTAIGTATILANSIYSLTYANGSSEWILDAGPTVQSFPTGTVMIFGQTAAPSGWTKSALNDDHALRLTTGTASTGGSTAFTSIMAARTIAQSNLPNVTLSVSSITLTADAASAKGAKVGAHAAASGIDFNIPDVTAAITVGGNVPLGGSGTALDFAVKYVDVIRATKT